MAHVTFIHGISNKPPKDDLLRSWLGVLADNDLDLDALGVTSEIVYWADLLYPEPLSELGYESAEDPELLGLPDVGLVAEDVAFVGALAATMGYDELATDEPAESSEPVASGTGFERVPLPWFVKRRLMKIFLRDVHHYLFDTEFTPRPDEKYKIQTTIRQRTIEALKRGDQRPGPHVLVTHSLGTLIGYDCLKRVDGCPAVDAFLTIGSPLGLDEIQDKLKPEWSRDNGFPELANRWSNVFDRLDPVAAFDPELNNDYRRDGEGAIFDIDEPNYGAWRHSIVKYFAGPRLRGELERMLQL
jgi:hypothetical protein